MVGIHQPNFLPWIGLIHKIAISDLFVVLDDVYYSKNQFQNRNTILTKNGTVLLSVPVKKNKSNKYLNKIEISYDINWRKKHLDTLYYSYKGSSNFSPFFERLEHIYQKENTFLIDLNMDIIKSILDYLNLESQMIFSSDLQVQLGKTGRLVDICMKLDSDCYIYGGDSSYLEREQFQEKGIKLVSQNFIHPTYRQNYSNEFVNNLSIIDWLFQASRQDIRTYFLSEKESFAVEYKKQFTMV